MRPTSSLSFVPGFVTIPISLRQGVEHDNTNVICMGSRVIGPELALDLGRIFLGAQFTGVSRHVRRLAKIESLEREKLRGLK